jgi:hypothetical protein
LAPKYMFWFDSVNYPERDPELSRILLTRGAHEPEIERKLAHNLLACHSTVYREMFEYDSKYMQIHRTY